MTFQLNYKVDGEVLSGANLMENLAFALTTSLNFVLDGATNTNQNNLKYDTFGSDTAQYLEFMKFNTGKYECIDTSVAYYVIIEASSLTPASFEINTCQVEQISSGKWLLYSNSGTYEVNRAKVFQTLYESAASSPLITAATSVTAIKTPDSADVGKNGHYITFSIADNDESKTRYKTGTFANTTTNTACSYWSYVNAVDHGSYGRWEVPSGSVLNTISATGDNNESSNEIGTDTSADELNNPATCQAEVHTGGSGAGSPNYSAACNAIILCVGSISWATTGDTGDQGGVDTDYAFATPALTATTESDLTCKITTDSTTITASEDTVIVKSLNTLTGANTVTTEVSFNGGTNWQTVTQKEIAKITNTGTSFRVRFTITRASNAHTDSINVYAAYYG